MQLWWNKIRPDFQARVALSPPLLPQDVPIPTVYQNEPSSSHAEPNQPQVCYVYC